MTNKVEICGVNTAKLPILKNDEKKALFDRILTGDKEARSEYIYGNLRLVLSVIQRFNNRGENADDIFQVGCIGLIKAIDNFDISQGVKFSTYAVPMNVICRNELFFKWTAYNHARIQDMSALHIFRIHN
jgi:RNA polymerase sporulation-specific sigma factor